ncbi:MAG: FTR1 family protein, partial [Glaciimonas sp.]|nr:FTR1 family protein [Glaciimonas sp.]
MGQILFIVWRESVEALLVVGILYAWLKNSGADARRGLPYLWAGIGIGVLAAIGLGVALLGFSELLSGDAQDYFQIGMVLVAAMLIVQMVYWMRKHGRTLKRDMESSLTTNMQTSNWWGVTILAALAIAREGSETVIFLYGLGLGQHASASGLMLPVILGFALAFLTFYLLQLGGKIFSWRRFFQVTEIILLFLAAGLLLTGIERLMSLDIIPTLIDPMWNSAWLLDDTQPIGNLIGTMTGYRAQPALMSLLTYAAYW